MASFVMQTGDQAAGCHFGDPRMADRVGHSAATIPIVHKTGFHRARGSAQGSNRVRRKARTDPTPEDFFYTSDNLSTHGCSSSDLPSSLFDHQDISNWRKSARDLEAGCVSWSYYRDDGLLSWIRSTLLDSDTFFGSKIDLKLRNPGSSDVIGYSAQTPSMLITFLWRFVMLFIYCFFISACHYRLGLAFGLYCGQPESTGLNNEPIIVPTPSMALIWSEALITTGACFLLAQGYFGLRSTRERMERVKQTGVTLAYSLIKTTTTDTPSGLSKDELQLVIYECLALLTAFPVALQFQLLGNTCEPAITKYCQDVARELQRLRVGENPAIYAHDSLLHRERNRHHEFEKVEYFFEIFSLHLQREFTRQRMRTKTLSMVSQHIIYNLRNHFENIVDLGNLDDRRTPIVRENIDMLALAGRECFIFSYSDVAPCAFLWSVDLACRVVAFGLPLQRCDWIVNSDRLSPVGEHLFQWPNWSTTFAIAVMAIIIGCLLTILTEMWNMWDPVGRGINMYSWTLGMAREIDNLLNEFYEYDKSALIRKHAYMNPSSHPDDMSAQTADSRPQTV